MMEEAVFARSGLLGLAVLAFITFFPRFVDRVTAWQVKHGENEDRNDERVTTAFLEELKGSRQEREASRLERAAYVAAQQGFSSEIRMLRDDILNLTILIKDFDSRLSPYFRSNGER